MKIFRKRKITEPAPVADLTPSERRIYETYAHDKRTSEVRSNNVSLLIDFLEKYNDKISDIYLVTQDGVRISDKFSNGSTERVHVSDKPVDGSIYIHEKIYDPKDIIKGVNNRFRFILVIKKKDTVGHYLFISDSGY